MRITRGLGVVMWGVMVDGKKEMEENQVGLKELQEGMKRGVSCQPMQITIMSFEATSIKPACVGYADPDR